MGGPEPMRVGVGWRERDWAKFNDDERRALFGGGTRGLPPSEEGRAHGPIVFGRADDEHVRGRGRRVGSGSAALLTAVVAAIAFVGYLGHAGSHVGRSTIAQALPGSSEAPGVAPPQDVVAIRWRPGDLAPAAAAGRICVDDRTHGHLCASYVVGERPADNLTRQLESLGLHVRSSG